MPVTQHVLIRFGKWDEILDQPLPDDPELYCVTTAMMHYARAVAYASTQRVAEAVARSREAFIRRPGPGPREPDAVQQHLP